MKIKFETFDKVKEFVNICTKMESDVLVKRDRYVVDGKSIMGVISIALTKELTVKIIEKNVRETDAFYKSLYDLGIVVE